MSVEFGQVPNEGSRAVDEVRSVYLDFADGPLRETSPGTYVYECEGSAARFEFVLGTLGHGQVRILFATVRDAVAVLDALERVLVQFEAARRDPNGRLGSEAVGGEHGVSRGRRPLSPSLARCSPTGRFARPGGRAGRRLIVARRRTGPADAVSDLVYRRDGGRCARCGSLYQLTVHHRVNRGMGGRGSPGSTRPTTCCWSARCATGGSRTTRGRRTRPGGRFAARSSPTRSRCVTPMVTCTG
ncbi:hypothetical protein NKH77_50315 [Streptomyces sp. M19]